MTMTGNHGSEGRACAATGGVAREYSDRRPDDAASLQVAQLEHPEALDRTGASLGGGALRTARAELEVQGRVQQALADGIRHIETQATLEQAAQAMCQSLADLPFIDAAIVCSFIGSAVRISGVSRQATGWVSVGDLLPEKAASIIRERTEVGPWSERLAPGKGQFLDGLMDLGIRAVACGPIAHGDHVDGAILLCTGVEDFVRMLVERMPGIVSCGAAASGFLAERQHAWRWRAELRVAIEDLVARRAFRPVFQPIVDLDGGRIVGYEALTRFESSSRPDLSFAQAWSVGLGPDLEAITLEAAIEAARALPAGRWLDLNISPRMLDSAERLRVLLTRADRPLVLEITEHDVIDDYHAARDAIAGLGLNIRVAVDDAGAGTANFGHVVELRPDLVKLDISLVRGVNANLGRQAMVVGMSHFSRTAGCRLVAEGVETIAEATALRELGVEFGQGYLFGRPAPAETWAASGRQTHPDATAKPAPGRVGVGSKRIAVGSWVGV
jgi:EAL domain-containing protein (putative c-di-GMP-specific phosphodiesterase class I)